MPIDFPVQSLQASWYIIGATTSRRSHPVPAALAHSRNHDPTITKPPSPSGSLQRLGARRAEAGRSGNLGLNKFSISHIEESHIKFETQK